MNIVFAQSLEVRTRRFKIAPVERELRTHEFNFWMKLLFSGKPTSTKIYLGKTLFKSLPIPDTKILTRQVKRQSQIIQLRQLFRVNGIKYFSRVIKHLIGESKTAFSKRKFGFNAFSVPPGLGYSHREQSIRIVLLIEII